MEYSYNQRDKERNYSGKIKPTLVGGLAALVLGASVLGGCADAKRFLDTYGKVTSLPAYHGGETSSENGNGGSTGGNGGDNDGEGSNGGGSQDGGDGTGSR